MANFSLSWRPDVDATHIVGMLSIYRANKNTTGGLTMEAVQKTPEREAFYKKIDGETFRALERDGRPDHAGAEERLPAPFVEVRSDP